MTKRLLLCTDLDRTLIPNGPQPESPGARERFARLVAHPQVTLAYVSGRDRRLVEKAMLSYVLPVPDFVIGDVGTTLYHVGTAREWAPVEAWEEAIAHDWNGCTHAEIKELLHGLSDLRPQERRKQNRHKLSYYVPLQSDRAKLGRLIQDRLAKRQVMARLVWSDDEPAGVGLLDILPAGASKRHAIEALMQQEGFGYGDTVFSGDSGNDIEVLASPVCAVLVANSQATVRERALHLAEQGGHGDRLHLARGGFGGMNGNYAAGILEGVAHYHPYAIAWMGMEMTGETV